MVDLLKFIQSEAMDLRWSHAAFASCQDSAAPPEMLRSAQHELLKTGESNG